MGHAQTHMGLNLRLDESMTRVLATATADLLRDGPIPLWEITVTGVAPHDHRRVYQLEQKTDTLAAQEGIELFIAEMSNLTDADEMGALLAGIDEQAG